MKMSSIHSFACTTLAIAGLLWLAAPRAAAADAKTNRSKTERLTVNENADPEEKVEMTGRRKIAPGWASAWRKRRKRSRLSWDWTRGWDWS